ncbi:hypothetical protein FSP39_016165 [Pinctada imbricata]|uniref:Ionotropic glutamate receptor C-terminal domain-containing protein n=1 Tax=Pinctada imbricata TaxID=66713 RepID=A0AA88Y969_PINIB|nr:hypothetical protein FSP39_016165 [Pinctada imbricata]
MTGPVQTSLEKTDPRPPVHSECQSDSSCDNIHELASAEHGWYYVRPLFISIYIFICVAWSPAFRGLVCVWSSNSEEVLYTTTEIDMVLAPLAVSVERNQVIDYGTTVYYDHSSFLMRSNNGGIRWYTVIKPFQIQTFVVLFAVFMGSTFCLLLVEKCSILSHGGEKSIMPTFGECLWYFFGASLAQGGTYETRSHSGAVFISLFWIYSAIVLVFYSGSLMSQLTVLKEQNMMETASDLARQNRLTYGTLGGSYYSMKLKNSSRPIYRVLYNNIMEFYKTDPEVLSTDHEVHYRKVKTEDYILILDKVYMTLKAATDCDLHISSATFDVVQEAPGFPKGSPIRDVISEQLNSFIDLSNPSLHPLPCECSSSDFNYSPCGHVITGDLSIVKNDKLRELLKKGPKYRESMSFTWNQNVKIIMDSCEEYARRWAKKEDVQLNTLSEWIKSIRGLLLSRINRLKSTVNTRFVSIFKDPDVITELTYLQEHYVITPADKASNNYTFTCKKYYFDSLVKELGLNSTPGNPTYTPTNLSASEIIDNHKSALASFGFDTTNLDLDLPYLYCIPKMHKNPYKQRFIAGSSKCSTKSVSISPKFYLKSNLGYKNIVRRYILAVVSTRCGF